MSFGQIRGMRGYLVGDHTDLDVIAIGQTQLLLGSDIAEHRRTEPADHGRSDGRCNVIVAGGDIGRERSQGVERRLAAVGELLVHVLLDFVHGDVPRAFDHDLAVVLPGDTGELTECFQLGELRRVVRVGDRTRAQAVTKGEADVIGAADLADFLEMLVQEAFLVMREAPLRHDRAAARDDPGHPVGGKRDVWEAHSGVNGEVIDALLRLFNESVAEDVPGELFGDSIDLFERLVNGYGANRHRRVTDDPFADGVNVTSGGKIHDGIRAPADRPYHFVDFLGGGGSDGRIADVGIDLHQEVAADDHRLGLRVIDVGRDDGAAGRDLGTHELRRDIVGNGGAPGVAVLLQLFLAARAAHILADGDVLHLRRDDAGARVRELRDGSARERLVGPRHVGKLGRGAFGADDVAVIDRFYRTALIGLHIPTSDDPRLPHTRQAALDVDFDREVGERTG